MSDTEARRAAFEAWISSPPFERETERFGEGSAWPGNYRELDVDLAWQAWSDATADTIARLTAERDALKTVMIAAAEEIHAHWEAHCDAEGYGPANLMRRLEEGIPSRYGYTAGAFAQLKAERDAARADARLAAYVRGRAEPAPDGWRIDVWISGAPSIETIDEALSAAMREGGGK